MSLSVHLVSAVFVTVPLTETLPFLSIVLASEREMLNCVDKILSSLVIECYQKSVIGRGVAQICADKLAVEDNQVGNNIVVIAVICNMICVHHSGFALIGGQIKVLLFLNFVVFIVHFVKFLRNNYLLTLLV